MNVRPYLAILRARTRALLQYRVAALAGIGTQLFWGFIRVMIFDAFYRSSSMVQPMTYQQTVSYLWMIQALLLLMPWRIDPEIESMIRDGRVAYELIRPSDLYWFWFARSLASRIAPMALRAPPLFILSMLFFGLQPPSSPGAALAFVASLGVAILLSSAINCLMAISLIWTITGEGIARLISSLATILSGSVVPLPLLPGWSQTLLSLLPFAGLIDLPFRLYLGHIASAKLPLVLGRQLLWTLALILLGRYLLKRGLDSLVIQGG